MILGVEIVGEPAHLSGGSGEDLSGWDGLKLTVTRVDMVHRSNPLDPSTEEVITVDEGPRVFDLEGDLASPPTILAHYIVPIGCVYQVRLITEEASILLAGTEHSVRIPAGDKTGIKIVPEDDVECFEIPSNAKTGAVAQLNPWKQFIRNNGVGFQMKPVIQAVITDLMEIIPGLVLDELVLRFKEGQSLEDMLHVLEYEMGALVMSAYPSQRYFRIRLPATIPLQDGFNTLKNRDDIEFVAPNSVMGLNIAGPDDPDYPMQRALHNVGLTQQHFDDLTEEIPFTGSYTPVVAVVDTGFNYEHREFEENLWINVAELPSDFTANNLADFDGDGHITGADFLNPPTDLSPEQQQLLDDYNLELPLLDIYRLTLFPFADGEDSPDDANSKVDDIIGWDFTRENFNASWEEEQGDNFAHFDASVDPGNFDHGTFVSGIVGARGNNQLDGVGVAWRVRLMHLRYDHASIAADNDQGQEGGAFRNSVMEAVMYAAENGADVINVSSGYYWARDDEHDCGKPGVTGLDHRIGNKPLFDKVTAELEMEAAMVAEVLEANNALLVIAAGNCAQNHDDPNLFTLADAFDSDNVVMVAGFSAGDWDVADGPELWGNTDFGPQSIEISAPSDNHALVAAYGEFGLEDTIITPMGEISAWDVGGTSFAAPTVAGAAALIIAADESYKDDPQGVRDRLLQSAKQYPALAGSIENGRVLDIAAALAL